MHKVPPPGTLPGWYHRYTWSSSTISPSSACRPCSVVPIHQSHWISRKIQIIIPSKATPNMCAINWSIYYRYTCVLPVLMRESQGASVAGRFFNTLYLPTYIHNSRTFDPHLPSHYLVMTFKK